MSKIKEQVVEILRDIPDDKVAPVIEILKSVRELYARSEEPAANNETGPYAMGIFSKYANPALIPLEKDAQGEAVKEKHAAN